MPFSTTFHGLAVTLPFGLFLKVGRTTKITKSSPSVPSTFRKRAVRVRTGRTAGQAPRATISTPEIVPAPTSAPVHAPDAVCVITVTAPKAAEPHRIGIIESACMEGLSFMGYFAPPVCTPVFSMATEGVAAASALAGAASRHGPGMLAGMIVTPLAAARRIFLGF